MPTSAAAMIPTRLTKVEIQGGERSDEEALSADVETDVEAERSGNDDLRTRGEGRFELQHDQPVRERLAQPPHGQHQKNCRCSRL